MESFQSVQAYATKCQSSKKDNSKKLGFLTERRVVYVGLSFSKKSHQKDERRQQDAQAEAVVCQSEDRQQQEDPWLHV